MQSPHFDISSYNGAACGTALGYEASNYKFHQTSYAPGHDGRCYHNFPSENNQTVQSYVCLDPPAYNEATPLYYSSATASHFDSPNSRKIQNGQTDVTDCTHAVNMTREHDNFLAKSQDSLMIDSSQDVYGSSNSTSINLNNNQLHHLHYQQQSRHHTHESSFDFEPENMASSKLSPDDTTIFGHTSVKIESFKTEPHHSLRKCEESLNIPSTAVSSASSRNIRQDFKTAIHRANLSNDHTESMSSSHLSESKTPVLKSSSETFLTKDTVADKKEDESSIESKPTMSYIALIAKAILEAEHKRLNLGSIYNWIEHHYPFYKNKGQGWRNSVRHNLSLNDCFIKAGRCEDGKGNYWAIHPANIQDFIRGDFRQRRRSRRRGRKKDCDMSMYNGPNGYLHSSASSLTHGVTFNPAALSAIYSPYTEAERRAYRLDEALLRQSVNNPFVKWYQQGSSTPGYGISTSPPACSTGLYPNPTSLQWPQTYTSGSTQTMYPALNSTFSR